MRRQWLVVLTSRDNVWIYNCSPVGITYSSTLLYSFAECRTVTRCVRDLKLPAEVVLSDVYSTPLSHGRRTRKWGSETSPQVLVRHLALAPYGTRILAEQCKLTWTFDSLALVRSNTDTAYFSQNTFFPGNIRLILLHRLQSTSVLIIAM